MDHKSLFEDHGIAWPVNLDAPEWSAIDFSGMLRREAEASCFLHSKFSPPDEYYSLEFIDINLT